MPATAVRPEFGSIAYYRDMLAAPAGDELMLTLIEQITNELDLDDGERLVHVRNLLAANKMLKAEATA
jgi:hypothetical protein